MQPIHQYLLPICVGMALGAPATAWSQAAYPEAEYIAGHSGFPAKLKGTLRVTPEGISFEGKDGAVAFSIPMSEITSASQQTDIVSASLGMRVLLGSLAGSRKQEFVQVAVESADNAEGIVFKVKKGTSIDIVTKINHFAKQRAVGDSTAGHSQAPPGPG
jgi:hypothetical protein